MMTFHFNIMITTVFLLTAIIATIVFYVKNIRLSNFFKKRTLVMNQPVFLRLQRDNSIYEKLLFDTFCWTDKQISKKLIMILLNTK